jgi:tetratricopeptide (TPR) repeat protein
VHYHRGRLGLVYWNFADLLRAIGRQKEAESLYRKTIALHEQLLADFPAVLDYPSRLATLYFNLGSLLASQGRTAEALELYDKGLGITPRNVAALQRAIWMRGMASDPQLRDSRHALHMAEQMIWILPDAPACWTTLALARYRAGAWKSAADALQKSLDLRNGQFDGATAFLLAMTYAQLQQPDLAKSWREKAVQWTDQHAAKSGELLVLWSETDELFKTLVHAP